MTKKPFYVTDLPGLKGINTDILDIPGGEEFELEFKPDPPPKWTNLPAGLMKLEVPREARPKAQLGQRELFRFHGYEFELEVTSVSDETVIFESTRNQTDASEP